MSGFNERCNNIYCDILYGAVCVGGEQNIKGFQHVVEFFEFLSKALCINIAMLGFYSESAVKKINEINRNVFNKSFIHVFGNVESCNEFYVKSKFLVLPIISPNFCRPAIESGFLKNILNI